MADSDDGNSDVNRITRNMLLNVRLELPQHLGDHVLSCTQTPLLSSLQKQSIDRHTQSQTQIHSYIPIYIYIYLYIEKLVDLMESGKAV